MTILDANVWIAFLNKHDTQHGKAEKVFASCKPPVGLPEYIASEIATVLNQKVENKVASQFLAAVTQSDDVEIFHSNEEFFYGVVALFQRQKAKKLSFADVALLYLSKDYEIITFDENLAKAIRRLHNLS